ncbi:MAG TPA: hypothetical protein VFB13_17720 [Reyranella sp.]|jgi:hypothetical protein|nr:hypothetical protein [Reyranella sp.]
MSRGRFLSVGHTGPELFAPSALAGGNHLSAAERSTLGALRDLLGETRVHIRDAVRTGRRTQARRALAKLETAIAVWVAVGRLLKVPAGTARRRRRQA